MNTFINKYMAHYNCMIHQLTIGFMKQPIPSTGEAEGRETGTLALWRLLVEVSSVSACPRAVVAVGASFRVSEGHI